MNRARCHLDEVVIDLGRLLPVMIAGILWHSALRPHKELAGKPLG